MRERIDCALLVAVQGNQPAAAALGQGDHLQGRLCIRHFHFPVTDAGCLSADVLAANAMMFRRFDAVLVELDPQGLGWFRRALVNVGRQGSTPVMVLSTDIRAPALNDLFSLGMADFVRMPICLEELRLRVSRIMAHLGPSEHDRPAHDDTSASSSARPCSPQAPLKPYEYEVGVSLCTPHAVNDPQASDSFRMAKGRVIERFERAYINAALGRHSGNIAMAARSAQKHRRAFWALMRKYQIDAAPYRSADNPKPVPEG